MIFGEVSLLEAAGLLGIFLAVHWTLLLLMGNIKLAVDWMGAAYRLSPVRYVLVLIGNTAVSVVLIYLLPNCMFYLMSASTLITHASLPKLKPHVRI